MRCLLQKRIVFQSNTIATLDPLSELQEMINQINLGHATLGAEYNLYIRDYVCVIKEVLKSSLAETFEGEEAHHVQNLLAKKPPVDPSSLFMNFIKTLRNAFNARLDESEVLVADLEIRKLQAMWSSLLIEAIRDSYKKLALEEPQQGAPTNELTDAITTLIASLSSDRVIQSISDLGANAPDLGNLLRDLECIQACLNIQTPFTAAVNPLVDTAEQALLQNLCGYVPLLTGTQLGEYLGETPDRCSTGDFCEVRALGILNLDMDTQILPAHLDVKKILESLQMLRDQDDTQVEEEVSIKEVAKEYILDTGYLYPRTTDRVLALVKVSAHLEGDTWNCHIDGIESDSADTDLAVALAKKLFELDLKATSQDAGTSHQPIFWKV